MQGCYSLKFSYVCAFFIISMNINDINETSHPLMAYLLMIDCIHIFKPIVRPQDAEQLHWKGLNVVYSVDTHFHDESQLLLT